MDFLKWLWSRIVAAVTFFLTIRNLGSTSGHRKLIRGQVGTALGGSIIATVPASYALLVEKAVETSIGLVGIVHSEKGHERLACTVLTALALSYFILGLYVQYSDTTCPYDPNGNANEVGNTCWTLDFLSALFDGLAVAWFGKSEFFKDKITPPAVEPVPAEPAPLELEQPVANDVVAAQL